MSENKRAALSAAPEGSEPVAEQDVHEAFCRGLNAAQPQNALAWMGAVTGLLKAIEKNRPDLLPPAATSPKVHQDSPKVPQSAAASQDAKDAARLLTDLLSAIEFRSGCLASHADASKQSFADEKFWDAYDRAKAAIASMAGQGGEHA